MTPHAIAPDVSAETWDAAHARIAEARRAPCLRKDPAAAGICERTGFIVGGIRQGLQRTQVSKMSVTAFAVRVLALSGPGLRLSRLGSARLGRQGCARACP